MKNTEKKDEDLVKIVQPLVDWYRENKRDLPWRHNPDAYRVWISEIMLQQTRVEAVKGYYDRFLKALPTVKDLAEAEEDKLLKLWEGLGYYNRVRNMQKAAQQIMVDHEGIFPDTYEEILQLKGIGNYTAGAISAFAYGIPKPAVDGNVLRVISRITGSYEDIMKQSVRKKIENTLEQAFDLPLVMVQNIRRAQNDGKLGQLRGLQGHAARQVDPAVAAVIVTGHEQRQHQQRQRDDVKCPEHIPQRTVVDKRHAQHDDKAHRGHDGLGLDEVVDVAAMVGVAAGIAGREHHNQPVGQYDGQRAHKGPGQMAPFLFGQADDPQHADDITKGAVKDHTQNAIQMRNQWVQASLLLMVDYAMQM